MTSMTPPLPPEVIKQIEDAADKHASFESRLRNHITGSVEGVDAIDGRKRKSYLAGETSRALKAQALVEAVQVFIEEYRVYASNSTESINLIKALNAYLAGEK